MYTKQEIVIKSHREGKSQRAISRELGISRKTVKKYIVEFEDRLASGSSTQDVISGFLSEAPVYNGKRGSKLKLTEEVQRAIDEVLASNEEKKAAGAWKADAQKV
ncbi:Homeodomain-like domain-containing protein [Arenibacter nanhaiticus]|uniref:Homeodomain-like domain-containing protein n=1 Tax=Arenibacter nanhaiticus TaxID=558155 RepID=A0A1M6FBP9_9FLAO|nr:sigma factor-like helix-turn-helix DNA-binding protein [Arenibacter nanhaiticus]SHI95102.1 Homeodomain-like domain-containing protein [Arenibacter nanhaiticus]